MKSQIKPICGTERVILAQAVPLKTPFSMFLFPTTYCNFRCNYCGHSLGYKKMKELYDFTPMTMEMPIFVRIVEQIAQFPEKLKLLSLTGHGEPLMNPNIADMVAYAKERNIAQRIEIISNGSLLTGDTAILLDEAGLDTIRISLQGLSSEKYKQICSVQIDFDSLVDNIRFLYNNRKNCQIYVKVLDVTLENGEEQKFYDIFGDITDRMYIEFCKPVYEGVNYENISITTDRYGNTHEKREVCPLCFYMLSVLPNGDVEPCDSIYKPIILGNVKNKTLTQMWNSEALRQFRIMQLKKERSNNPKCKVCCAPDDVSQPEDALDYAATEVLSRFEGSSSE